MIHIVSASDYRMREHITFSVSHAKRLGYQQYIYDLGGLGFGERFEIESECFRKYGHYGILNSTVGWKSRAVHKPTVIAHALQKIDESDWLVYLDADAAVIRPIPEIAADYDVGVTVRSDQEASRLYGKINAGVAFFRKSAAVVAFVAEWEELTQKHQHDQTPLNFLVNDNPKVRVQRFRCEQYNYHAFPAWPGADVKILHFKSNARPFFRKYQEQLLNIDSTAAENK